jgi:hypothetical protein
MGEEIHDETGHPLVDLEPVDADEVGMSEILPDPELVLELPTLRLVGDELAHQNLDRHLAPFAGVKGLLLLLISLKNWMFCGEMQ